MRIGRIASVGFAIALSAGLAACGSSTPSSDQKDGSVANTGALVGITMPTKSSERWIHDGDNLKLQLEALGYKVDLRYAENDIPTQVNQIENQITKGAKLLIIASIDGGAITGRMQEAADKHIPVIAYDRLIRNTPNVGYYATFDNYLVGKSQGDYLVKQLGLDQGKGPFNLEPFSGSSDDNNAKLFFAGAWDVLSPYVKSGKLVIPSGKKLNSNDDWKNISIDAWSTQKAQAEMDSRLATAYTNGKKVDAVLSPNDTLALGIEQSLEGRGYRVGQDWPVITGQDADLANTKNILAGKQSMTVWKDTRELAKTTVKMADAVLKGNKPEVNNTTDYNNGSKVVPSFLLQPVVVTKDNYRQVLVDSGYYTLAQLS